MKSVLQWNLAPLPEDLALTCHAHPTYSEAVREAALACGDGAIHS
jgi:dihydrolipoamide dehydrogenase